MGFDFNFRTVEDRRDRLKLIDFLALQDLGYPRYDEWVQRVDAGIEFGWKTGIIALSQGRVVGDLIYQAHKKMPRVRELKNLRIDPAFENRYFGKFMLRQAEIGLGNDFDLILCDARADQLEVIRFMVSCRYKVVAKLNLYDDNLDVVLAKSA